MERITRLHSGAARSLKGTTKRGDVKIFTGGEAYCMSEGERWRNLRQHTVYLVAVMFGAGGESVNLWTTLSFIIRCQFSKRCV